MDFVTAQPPAQISLETLVADQNLSIFPIVLRGAPVMSGIRHNGCGLMEADSFDVGFGDMGRWPRSANGLSPRPPYFSRLRVLSALLTPHPSYSHIPLAAHNRRDANRSPHPNRSSSTQHAHPQNSACFSHSHNLASPPDATSPQKTPATPQPPPLGRRF